MQPSRQQAVTTTACAGGECWPRLVPGPLRAGAGKQNAGEGKAASVGRRRCSALSREDQAALAVAC
jgi:hypothetical protein